MPRRQTELDLNSDRPTCVDIYCGAGGTTYGAQAAGLRVAYGLDRDGSALRTFAANHPDAYADHRDVASVSAEILDLGKIDKVDFLLSGPNCQAVSTMGLFWDGDPRNLLFVHLARLIDELINLGKPPRNVLVENVPGIAFKKNIRIVQDLVRFFRDRDYRCAADVVNFATWGLPQLRHRFILMATRDGVQPSLPVPTACLESGEGLVTSWDAISDLAAVDPVAQGRTATRVVDRPDLTPYQLCMRGSADLLHNHHEGRTAPIDVERIRHVPPGGCWKDLPPELIPDRFKKVRMTDYKTLYGRLLKGHPSYTIYAAYGNVTSGCFTHPEQDQPLTVREGMRLQGFPDDFIATGSVQSQYRQIGNAVPAYAAEVLIRHWLRSLDGEDTPSVPLRLDEKVLFRAQPPRLPVLTPRYKLIGYGSGTYWPKGWGAEPENRPNSSSDYRISDEPIRYRRLDWRFRRDAKLAEHIEAASGVNVGAIIRDLNGSKQPVVLLEGGQVSGEQSVDPELARRSFMTFLAPAVGVVAALAATDKRVLVHCDFGLTADWFYKFLELLIEKDKADLLVENSDGDRAGRLGSERHVRVVTEASSHSLEPGVYDILVLARPFADWPQSASRAAEGAVELTTPKEVVAKQLRANAQDLLSLLRTQT